MIVEIRASSISEAEALTKLDRNGCGSVVLFSGVVRPMEGERTISSLHYEHYPGMAERAITVIASEAMKKFKLKDTVVIHRIGDVPAGDISIVVAVSSERRKNSFAACSEIIDRLKTTVPIWKKETGETTQWQSERLKQRVEQKPK